MPVPKKRVGHSEQGHRRSTWKATVPAISKCTNCGAPRHPHTMCGTCGFYKDRIVLKALADEEFESPAALDPVEPEMAEEAPAKKTKKAAKAKDVSEEAHEATEATDTEEAAEETEKDAE